MSPGGPLAQAWQAQAHWRAIDLLSDVHLHAALPRTFDAWRDHMLGTPADAVLILGDLFEVWVGDDARCGAFEQACCEVLRVAAEQRTVAFMAGNRDFLVGDGLLKDCGVQPLPDPTLLVAWGTRWVLTHGDALCLGDTDYLRFRSEVRTHAWKSRFLALPLAQRQQQARAMRDASTTHQATKAPAHYADVDGPAADAWLAHCGAEAMVHGHTHRPATHVLPSGRLRHVLGDWDFDGAVPRASILRLTPEGGLRMDLAGSQANVALPLCLTPTGGGLGAARP